MYLSQAQYFFLLALPTEVQDIAFQVLLGLALLFRVRWRCPNQCTTVIFICGLMEEVQVAPRYRTSMVFVIDISYRISGPCVCMGGGGGGGGIWPSKSRQGWGRGQSLNSVEINETSAVCKPYISVYCILCYPPGGPHCICILCYPPGGPHCIHYMVSV